MFYTYTTNQQIHIYKHVQSLIILHQLVSVAPVTIIVLIMVKGVTETRWGRIIRSNRTYLCAHTFKVYPRCGSTIPDITRNRPRQWKTTVAIINGGYMFRLQTRHNPPACVRIIKGNHIPKIFI